MALKLGPLEFNIEDFHCRSTETGDQTRKASTNRRVYLLDGKHGGSRVAPVFSLTLNHVTNIIVKILPCLGTL